jgi:hypothetical protein
MDGDAGTAARWAVELEAPADAFDPVAQALQTRTGVQTGSADAVIGDLDPQVNSLPRDVHGRPACVCVTGGVRERLRDDVGGGRCDRIGRTLVDLDFEVDRDG